MKHFYTNIYLILLLIIVPLISPAQFTTLDYATFPYILDKFILSQFEGFLDETKIPLSKIKFHPKRKYSPDFKYYVDASTEGLVVVNTINGNPIFELTSVSIHDNIIWLDSCLIFDRFKNDPYTKVCLNLNTGEINTYKTIGKFRFIGQTNVKSYFVSITDYSEIEEMLLKSRESLISISDAGVLVEYENPTVQGRFLRDSLRSGEDQWEYIFSDTMVTFDYYNTQLSIGAHRFERLKPPTRYIYNYNRFWTFHETLYSFYTDRNVYYHENYTYALFNNKYIYRFGEDEIKKVINCEELRIENFRIDGEYLIFNSKTEKYYTRLKESVKNRILPMPTKKGDYLVGVLNLNTMEIVFPKIIYKK